MTESTVGYFHCEATGQSGWIDRSEIRLPIDDLGFRQAVTAVERLRTYERRPFLVAAHVARLDQTLQSLHVPRRRYPDWSNLTRELLERNHEAVITRGEVSITWWATPGERNERESPTFAVHLGELTLDRIKRHQESGQSVVATTIEQPSENSWSRQAKVRCRLHYYLADQQAAAIQPGAMGLLRDRDGSLTESSVANFALVRGEEIHSPPASQVLGGITQMHVQGLAKSQGIAWHRGPLFDRDLDAADELMLMGTDGGLWFGNSYNGRIFESPASDGVLRRLQKCFAVTTQGGESVTHSQVLNCDD